MSGNSTGMQNPIFKNMMEYNKSIYNNQSEQNYNENDDKNNILSDSINMGNNLNDINNQNLGMNQNILPPIMGNPTQMNFNPMMPISFPNMNYNDDLSKVSPIPMMPYPMNSIQNNMMFDNDSFKIQNIIAPYELRIQELQETIRRNNFEIALLKYKQLKNEENQKKEIMNENEKNEIENKNGNFGIGEIYEIIFQFQNDSPIKIKCLDDELIESVLHKFCENYDFNRNNFQFFFDSEIQNTYLTVSELGLKNGSIINIYEKKPNIYYQNKDKLIFNYKEKGYVIFFTEKSTVDEVLKAFIKKKRIKGKEVSDLIFTYNNNRLLFKDNRLIKDICKENGDIKGHIKVE